MGIDLVEAIFVIEDDTGIEFKDENYGEFDLESSIGDIADIFARIHFEKTAHQLHNRAEVKQRILNSVITVFAEISCVPAEEITRETSLSSIPLD